MVISSWLSAFTSTFFGKKTPRTRNQQTRLAVQATQASEVLESRQMLTVNAIADAYNAGNGFTITEDEVFNVNATDGVVQSNDNLTNLNGAYAASIVSNTAHGTVTLNADGSFSYDPGTSLQGLDDGETSVETFSYNVTDNDGTSNTVNVVLTVVGVNDDPEAEDDSVIALEDTVTPVDVLANDTDVDGDPLIVFVGSPQHGTAAVNNNGTPNDASDDFVDYTPNEDYNGPDSFTYIVSDGHGGLGEATVSITVVAVNDPPVAADATVNLAENSNVGTVVGTVTATDTDSPDTKTFAITGGNTDGTFAINPTTGQITVANNALLDFETTPVFHLVVTVSDGTDAEDTADVTINLTNVAEALVLSLPSSSTTFYSRHGQTVIDAAASVHGDQLPLFSYANSQLTVQVTGNANKNDRIAIFSQFAGPGKVSLSGSNVLYGNVVIGKITKQGSGTTPLVVKFNANATEASVNAVLKLVTYKSAIANPPAAQRTITFTLQDATNSQHVSATQLVNVNTSAPQRGIDINGDPVSYSTGGGPVLAAPNALLTGGPAYLDFDGGNLSVETRGGSNSTNRLGILETGGITLSGTDVLYNGNKIAVATITNNSIKFKLVSLDSTPAAVQALVRSISFYTTASNTNLADREIVFKLTDANTVKSPTVSNTITVTQSAPNAQPTATNTTHSATYTEDGGAQALGAVIVVSDPDAGEVITASLTLSNTAAGSLAATGASYNSGTGVLSITGSVATVNTALASLTFTPVANFNGNFTVGVNIQDGGEASTDPVTGTITVTGIPVNDQISVTNITHSATYTEDGGAQALGATMVVSDVDAGEIVTATLMLSDPNAGTLSATGASYNSGTGVLTISGTVATVNTALAALRFTPSANYDDDVAVFVNVQDAGENGTLPVFGTITATATAVNDQTTATNVTHAATYTEDAGAQSLGSTIVVTDVDSSEVNTATLTLSDLNAGVLAATGGTFNGANGTLTLTGSVAAVNTALASLTFTPAANYDGNFTIGVNIQDGLENGTVAVTGTITVTGTAVNDVPVANANSFSVNEDGSSSGTLTASDDDATDTLTYSIVGSPTHGTISGFDAATGAYTYTPNANYFGSDSFTFKVNDGTVDSNTATISITVNSVNDEPAANANSFSLNEDGSSSGTLTASDDDVTDTLTYSIVGSPTHGTISGFNGATGAYTYTPNANYFGSESCTFKVNDGTADSNTATITITVNSVNDTPVADANSFSVNEDGSSSGTLTASDNDPTDTLTYSIVGTPTHGTISGFDASTGAYTYTPAANYFGSDSFTFKVTDGTVDSNTATISITVNSLNDTPTANADLFSVDEDDFFNGTLTGSDIDVGDVLTYAIGTGPAHGVISNFDPATGDYTYTPTIGYDGPDLFTFTVNDGTATSAEATINITVDPIP